MLARSSAVVRKAFRNSAARTIPKRTLSQASTFSSKRGTTIKVSSLSIARRYLSTSSPHSKGLFPDSSDPAPPVNEDSETAQLRAAEVTAEQYHELADTYLENILRELETLQEQRQDADVEFSVNIP